MDFTDYEQMVSKALRDISGIWTMLGLPAVTHDLMPKTRLQWAQSLRNDLLVADDAGLNDLMHQRARVLARRFDDRFPHVEVPGMDSANIVFIMDPTTAPVTAG